MASGLVAFLKARLDEDEARRWAVHDVSKCDALLYEDLPATEPPPDAGACECGYPARVLREVEAKRAILAEHAHQPLNGCRVCADGLRWVSGHPIVNPLDSPCPTIRALAAVYSGHPDYDPAWAVSGA